MASNDEQGWKSLKVWRCRLLSALASTSERILEDIALPRNRVLGRMLNSGLLSLEGLNGGTNLGKWAAPELQSAPAPDHIAWPSYFQPVSLLFYSLLPMSTDLLWQQQQQPQSSAAHLGQGGGEERDREHEISDSHSQLTQNGSHHVQEWDPSAFLNPSMFSSDLVNGGQTQNHFQLDPKPMPQMAGQQNIPQNAHIVQNQYSFGQEPFPESFNPDTFGQPFDLYSQSQATRQSFEAAGFHPSSQSTSDLSPSMAHLGLHQELMYSPPGPYQQQHSHHIQNLQGHFEFHQSPEVAPNGRASPHPRASPFAISPASNHSFSTQQDYSGVLERRPSTADSVHSLRGEYTTDFAMLPTPAVDLGRPINSNGPAMLGPGVVPSNLHPFNQRSNGAPSFAQHLPQDGQHVNRSYIPVAAAPPQTGGPQQGSPFISQHSYPSQQASQYAPDQNYHISPHALDSDASVYPPLNTGSSDVAHFIR